MDSTVLFIALLREHHAIYNAHYIELFYFNKTLGAYITLMPVL